MQPRPLTAYTINVDETLARVSDALQSALDKLPNSNIEITDDVKDTLMAQIADAVGGALETISANLEDLSNLDGMNFGASAGETFTQVDTTSGSGSQISFCSVGCWDKTIPIQNSTRNRRHGYLYRNTLPKKSLIDAQPCRHKA